MQLRVAHFYPWVYLTSGIERTIVEMVRRSRHAHTIFTNHFVQSDTYREFAGMNVVQLEKVSVKRSIIPVLRAAFTLALQKLPLDQYDVLMIHCDGLGDLALLRSHQIPCICFCHTPLRVVFDPIYRRRVRARYRGLFRIPFDLLSSIYGALDRRLWKRYKHVILNSRETLKRAQHGGLLDKDASFSILHPGCDLSRFRPGEERKKFFLAPGRIMWTKNLETAIRGFLEAKAHCPEMQEFSLIVAGRVDEKSKHYLALLRELVMSRDDVQFRVNPEDEELIGLYRSCCGVVCVAENEDWGIVPLEANACGKPVIATFSGGLAESQVDGVTALLVNPEPEAVGEAFRTLVHNPVLSDELGANGLLNSKRFDWGPFVESVDELLEGIVRKQPIPHNVGRQSESGIFEK